ncbi:hypothetical protein J5X98_26550 [Leptothermofonsia sichuanensis E412]|uniref:hypothetical protein n=1 Tax=Leptothermofonsia sichuanensis TaxID=2917832 RepID=UPI001CA6B245|nr:hypothetical protein [Leptothermofonsia sichuanensis]QZZ20734.1 hypothetical protein J5X98_26550 [Leptothermofonsia sichuanensis E412]
MYTTWAKLWEGWTKVLYVGAWRNIWLMLLLVVTMLSLYTIPWLGFVILLAKGLMVRWNVIDGLSMGLILSSLGLQYYLRSQTAQLLHCPAKYWWLQSIGGLLITMMAIASVIKVETGWGWTWRGRSLK